MSDSTIDDSEPRLDRRKGSACIEWVYPSDAVRVSLLPHLRHLIGRDSDCDVQLEGASVSRRHAEIYRQGPVLAIRDLGSRNGTHVDGRAVAHAPLRAGQLLRIGDYIGTVGNAEDAIDGDAIGVRELAPGMLGGRVLAKVLNVARRAATRDLPIIIRGETGTGKELVARAIHAWSGRTGPFYAINCATLSASIADAELFGYRRGAFTGAGQGHLGHFRAAHGGTLFLDEIAELSLESQAKLLRALEQREVLPIGEHRAVAVDVRVVCASQTELERAVAQGQFRADLRARLSGHTCVLPALRERREDVPALFLALLGRYTAGRVPALSAKLVEALCLYSWPNNVRELELLARSLTALHADEARLGREFLPENVRGAPLFQPAPARREAESTRENYELTELARVLHSTGGNVARAAAELGLSRQRLYRLMDRRPVREFMNEYSSQQASTKAADAE